MAKPGLAVVQAGASVEKASGYEYVASSEWPTLSIIKEGPISIDRNAAAFDFSPLPIYEHNKGHFMPYIIYGHPSTLAADNFNRDYDTSRLILENTAIFSMTKNALIYQDNLNYEGYFYVFDYNLETPFTLDSNKAGVTKTAAENTFGFKVPNPDKFAGIDSPRLENYYANTKGRSLTVHENGKQTAASNRLTITHNLGYLPSYLLFGPAVTGEGISQASAIVTATNDVITLAGAQSTLTGDFYFLIFKEPFLLSP